MFGALKLALPCPAAPALPFEADYVFIVIMHRECRDINLGAGLAAAHPDAASGQHGERAEFRDHPHVHNV